MPTALLDAVVPGDVAVFDADGTVWEGDVTESLLEDLERDRAIDLDGAPLPLPPLPGEGVFAYYLRVTSWDVPLGYQWAVQVFAGQTVEALTERVRALQTKRPPGRSRSAPRVRSAIADWMEAFSRRGGTSWIVSASPESLVRALALDPVYGLPLRPEHVIGVDSLWVEADGERHSFGMQRDAGKVPHCPPGAVLTAHLRTPLTWYEGKVAAIDRWVRKTPVLVAGDSANDRPMLRRGRVGVWFGNPDDGRADGFVSPPPGWRA